MGRVGGREEDGARGGKSAGRPPPQGCGREAVPGQMGAKAGTLRHELGAAVADIREAHACTKLGRGGEQKDGGVATMPSPVPQAEG